MSTGSLVVVVVAALLALAPLGVGASRAARVLLMGERIVAGVGVLALRTLLLPPSPVLTAMSFLVAASAGGVGYAIAVLARRPPPGPASRPSSSVSFALIGAAAVVLAVGAFQTQAARAEPTALAAWQAIERDTLPPVSVDPVDPGATNGPCASLTGTGKCVLLIGGAQCVVIRAETHPTFLRGDSDPHYACAELAVARVPGTPQLLAFPRGDAVRTLDGDHLGATLTRASMRLGPPVPWLALALLGLLFGAGTIAWARGRPDGDLRVRHGRLVILATSLPALLAVLVRLAF